MTLQDAQNAGYISTHTLTWSVTRLVFFYVLSKDISTHTLTWSVTCSAVPDRYIHRISTHTLTWSVTVQIGASNPTGYHFNSHAHVERDAGYRHYSNNGRISTHTLTWSVTDWLKYENVIKDISTHTLTWSVTF